MSLPKGYIGKGPPRERLKPGQHMRHYIRKKGRIGLLWEPFKQRMLAMWWAVGYHNGASDTVQIRRKHMQDEPNYGYITRTVNHVGQYTYKGDGITVGHKEGRGRDRKPEDRHNPEACEPQSMRYNAYLETIAQKKG